MKPASQKAHPITKANPFGAGRPFIARLGRVAVDGQGRIGIIRGITKENITLENAGVRWTVPAGEVRRLAAR